jgi:hypothetical protein
MAPLLPFLLLLPVLLLPTVADAFPASCSNATCGEYEIHYPFWLNSSGYDNCGYPGLGLACEDNSRLILSVQGHRYRIISFEYNDHVVAVSDADAELDEYGGGCPRLHWNLTIDYSSSWLQLASSDSNVTFLYNCKKDIPLPSAVELRGCQGVHDNKRSYVLPDGVSNGAEAYDYECEDVVVAPVLGVHKTGTTGTPPLLNVSLGDVIRAGFEFIYKPNSQFCSRCERSGGWCGYRRNHTNGDMGFTCFCDSGPTTERCGAYASCLLSSPSPALLVFGFC